MKPHLFALPLALGLLLTSCETPHRYGGSGTGDRVLRWPSESSAPTETRTVYTRPGVSTVPSGNTTIIIEEPYYGGIHPGSRYGTSHPQTGYHPAWGHGPGYIHSRGGSTTIRTQPSAPADPPAVRYPSQGPMGPGVIPLTPKPDRSTRYENFRR